MAYQAKRNQRYEEEFQLTEEDGTVVHTLQVKLDADSMVKRLSEKHLELVKALRQVQEVHDTEDEEEKARGLETLGNAVVSMLEAVFGKDDTETIVAFYDSRYIEMCNEVIPFIIDVVIPKVRKISKNNKKEVLSKYGPKSRRSISLKKR